MLDRNRIKTFAWSSLAFFNGCEDYNSGCADITEISVGKNGDVSVEARICDTDKNVFDCGFSVSKTDTVKSAYCSCPYRCDAYGYCRHVVAAMLRYGDYSKDDVFTKRRLSSPVIGKLIKDYIAIAKKSADNIICDKKVQLIPVLSEGEKGLLLSLKIGRERKYIIKNIPQLIDDIENNTYRYYGRELEFNHCPESFDEDSRRLIEYLSALVNVTAHNYSLRYGSYDRNKYIPLRGRWIERLFDIIPDSMVMLDDCKCRIRYDDPEPAMKLEKTDDGMYRLSLLTTCRLINNSVRACFFDDYKKVFYICSYKFSAAVCRLFEAFAMSGMEMEISEEDMHSFYASVMMRVKDYITIETNEDLSEFVPPEAEIRLYLDSPSPSVVYGRLEYTYGTLTRPAFSGEEIGAIYNASREAAAEKAVLKYFIHSDNDPVHPLFINDEDTIYELCSHGINELIKLMEVYASDRFTGMKLHPPIRPTVGVRLEGGLLALDIDAGGFEIAELAQMLASYRKGRKYHRLKDGSFIDLAGGGIEEFAELAEGLDISDKALLKQNITVPKFRMLYLDSLHDSTEGIQIKRSTEFRNAVRDFSEVSSEDIAVPQELKGTLREYQEYGFRWLRTILAYGFGGILADDMGLGKTLQAICLMLWEKQEHTGNTCLVVCPSSLTLNWESEIKRFAPSLKAAAVIGNASARSELIRNYREYDVLITSYSMLTRDIAEYEEAQFYIQFIDEAQFIKNHNTQASKAVKGIKSSIRFALTGTPVENSLAELWSIFDFIMPGYLFNYNHFKKVFESPIVKNKDVHAVKSLQRMTSPFILRRLKKDVLKELPDKTEISLIAEMGEEQQKLYAANVLSMKKQLKKKFAEANPNESKIEILAMLMRLRQICCDPSLVYENYSGGSAKLEQCAELIESCIASGHKLLLFSQFTSMLDIIGKRLKKSGTSYYLLTGATKAEERLRLVNAFNSDDTKVFMISLKAGGTGLNLTGADIVIHYDPWWNLSAENQAADRAYRIGQKNNVTVYRLIAKNTIEEKIQHLQRSKKELADMAVNGSGSIMEMNTEDIMSLFE